MVSRRNQPQQPVRRSGRIASRAGSRASSVGADDSTSVAAKVTKSRKKKASLGKLDSKSLWDAARAVERIMRFGEPDRDYVRTLTDSQAQAVVVAFVDQNSTLNDRISELEYQNEQIAKERDIALRRAEDRRTIRDVFFRDRLQQQQISTEPSSPQSTQQDLSNTTTTRPVESTSVQSEDISNTQISQTTPGSATSEDTDDAQIETSSPKPATTSFLRRMFSNLASPFTSRRTSEEQTPRPTMPQEPLGELPASRKRPATEEPEPEPLKKPESQSEPKPEQNNLPSTPAPQTHHDRFKPTPLPTISERTEDSIAVEPTPSRNRSINQAREQRMLQQHRQMLSNTPQRAWTPKRVPREPNADARLEKYHRYSKLNEELKTLKEDQEIQNMVRRPLKRVKIDELVSIPHRLPGDPVSCFRVYEVDSDDEMEVEEEDIHMRANVFARATEEDGVKRTGQEEAQVEQKVSHKFHFPSVGQKKTHQFMAHDYEIAAGAKFGVGLSHWLKTGQCIDW